MRRQNLEGFTIDQLLHRYVEIGERQYDAWEVGDTAKFSRLFTRMSEMEAELRRRGPEARRSLLQLYDHENLQVRLNAAKSTLAIAPEPARAELEDIRSLKWPHLSLDAGMCIRALDEGIFKPI